MNKSVITFSLIVLIAIITVSSLIPSILHIIFNAGVMVIIIVIAYIFYKIGKKSVDRRKRF